MNKLLFDKGKTINILKRYESTIKCNEDAVESLIKSREKLISERDNIIKPELSPLLFYFYSEKDLNLIEPNDFYVNYYYDYKTEQISTTTSKDEAVSGYPNAIDVRLYFKDMDDVNEDTFKEIVTKLNRFVDYLINEYNPEYWSVMNTLVREGLKSGEFEIATRDNKLTK